MGMYGDLHKEFARRTRDNLRFIDAAKQRGEPVYEATQLINSLLGMVVFLKEGNRLESTGLRLWREKVQVDILIGKENSITDFKVFIRKFRNAIAHCNIEEYGVSDAIQGLELTNKCRCEKIIWKVKMNLTNIKSLANLLVEHVLEERQPK